MAIVTKTTGYHIINGHEILLEPGQQVSYRDDADVESFNTREAAMTRYALRFPEQAEKNRRNFPEQAERDTPVNPKGLR